MNSKVSETFDQKMEMDSIKESQEPINEVMNALENDSDSDEEVLVVRTPMKSELIAVKEKSQAVNQQLFSQ